MRATASRLKEAIDYRAINRYLHGGQHIDENVDESLTSHSALNLKANLFQRSVNGSLFG